MKRALPVFLLILLAGPLLHAQTRTISGTVTDERSGETLPAVNVLLKSDMSVGTATDLDGRYSLNVPAEAEALIFRFVGYDEKEVVLEGSGNAVLNIQLGEADLRLNTVVVSASKRREKVLDAPASVTVIGSEKIESSVALTPIDHLRKVPGVDIMTTGLTSANVNLRGFNNIFSGAMLTVVDNRFARVPSLRLNAFQLIPTNNADIERMEVVRGPGSALYGPNAADGVLQIITKSPLDLEVGQTDFTVSMGVGFKQGIDTVRKWDETTMSMTERGYDTGERLIYQPEIRIAGRPSEKFGYKLSAQYLKGNDWVTYDPREPAIGTPMITGSIQNGQPFSVDTSIAVFPFERDFNVEKIGGDLRLDYAPSDDLNFILNAGWTRASNLELTGLGAGQALDWQYSYAQLRMTYKNLFVQYFVNNSNAGDTYLIPQSPDDNRIQQLIDRSQLHVLSVQHSANPVEDLNLIYGVDVLLTRPNTDGTINGRFEDADNVNQAGVYVQGEYEASDAWKFVAATRVDYHDPLEEFQISPRAAIVYKPAPKHTVRGTYNRAFSTPSTLNIALDLANGIIPNGIGVRGIGNPNGYSYHRDDNGDVLFVNPYITTPGVNNLYSPFTNTNNTQLWTSFRNTLGGLLADGAGLPALIFQDILSQLTNGMGTAVQNIDLIGIDYAAVAQRGDADLFQTMYENQFNLGAINDFGPVESSITQTFEVGYKGLLANDKLFFNLDGYFTKIDNFVTPLTNAAPSMVFDPMQLAMALGPNEPGGLLYDNLAAFEAASASLYGTLVGALDGAFGAPDGSIHEEFVNIISGGNAQLTLGTVAPNDSLVGSDVILTYRNLDEAVMVLGADLGFTYLVGEGGALSGSFSWVNRDSIAVEGAAGGYIALNAPKYKFSLGYDHTIDKIGLTLGATFRWNDGFPANSAVYIGRVDPYHILDARLAWQPNFSENSRVLLDVSNVLGIPYTTFPGVPDIGRVTFVKLQHTF